MKGSFKHQYKTVSKSGPNAGKGIDVYVYTVTGSKEELAKFKAAQGEQFREDEQGNPLFFTQKVLPRSIDLGISTKTNRVFPNTSEMDNINNLANQYKGVLGQEIARLGAAQILNSLGKGTATSAPVTAEVAANGLAE